MADDTTGLPAAPSGVFATFKNSIQRLVEGVPNQIDRTVFPGTSWAATTQLLSALRFFGLIDETGKPLPQLHALANPDEAVLKTVLERLVRDRYAPLFALDLMKTTPAELDQCMTNTYNITGDTRKKAVRFFIAALDYLGIEISPLLAKSKLSNGGGAPVRRRRQSLKAGRQGSDTPPDEASRATGAPSIGAVKTVRLSSGGTLSLSATLDLFSLSPADRTFVFKLIDELDQYQKENRQPDDDEQDSE